MGISIKCVCIDDKSKPTAIPAEKWPKEGEVYHISHIFIMKNQNDIQGCELSEFDISMHKPYNCYRLNRFAISEDDIGKMIEMMEQAGELNGVNLDIDKLIKQVPIEEVCLN